MKLDEKHKEFAVKCYARFMTRTKVVEAFHRGIRRRSATTLKVKYHFEETKQEISNQLRRGIQFSNNFNFFSKGSSL